MDSVAFSHEPYFVGCPPVTGESVSAEAGNVAQAGTLRLTFAPSLERVSGPKGEMLPGQAGRVNFDWRSLARVSQPKRAMWLGRAGRVLFAWGIRQRT